MIRVLSLGAGVQSSTLALMSAQGEIEPYDCAIFADTGWEPKDVYEWMAWLEQQLPFPVHKVDNGNLPERVLKFSAKGEGSLVGRSASIPFFTLSDSGSRGMLPRQCTSEHKVLPVYRKLRELVGLRPRQRAPKEILVHQDMGISFDEMQRMKYSNNAWIEYGFPLIDLRMRRFDCIAWMERNGYPRPPRSACVGCPYHSDKEWKRIKDSPVDWADAVGFERKANAQCGYRDQVFLHASRKPLDEVDFSTAEDHGQLSMLDECDGMCGV